jgi:hypothetical protein
MSGGLSASGGQLAVGGLPAAGGVSGPDLWADGQYAAQIIAEPVRGDQTAAGLPVRVPRANLLPGSAGGGRPAGHGLASRQAGGGRAKAPVAQRSPELARSRLSGLQGGIRRAKGHAPGTGEENGR